MNSNKPKVIVGMSGGVDSSVAACLLLEQGYDVVGMFMKFWSEGDATKSQSAAKHFENKCCSVDAYEDARSVASKLGIKLYTLNMKFVFKKYVVDDFIKGYACGRTPNPCVECNKYIKFGKFLTCAKSLGADYIATGHYVRMSDVGSQKSDARCQTSEFGLHTSSFILHTAKDKTKDQSYFLWTLTQSQLKHCLFPIGNYLKPQVRALAKKFDLPVHEKEDSEGLCFIKDKRHYDFLRHHLKLKPGPIITLDGVKEKGIKPGSVIGEHQGLPLYTIGQRREILIGGIGPFYVVKLDYGKNILYVANKFDKELLYKDKLTAKNVNWISGTAPKFLLKCQARIRYLHSIADCELFQFKKNQLRVKFSQKQRAITPGQSVVFYLKNGEMLGGGVIV